MRAEQMSDAVLRDWFDETAAQSDATGLHDAVIGRVRRTRQRPRWLAAIKSRDAIGPSVPLHRLAYVSVIVAAVLAGAVLWSRLPAVVVPITSPTPGPSPTTSATASPPPTQSPTPSLAPGFGLTEGFVLPFTYAIPDQSSLVNVIESDETFVAWVEGRNEPDPNRGGGSDGQLEVSGNERGIVVARVDPAWSHDGGTRFWLSTSPRDLLIDLRDIADVAMSEPSATTLDDREGFEAIAQDPGFDGNDIHTAGPLGGLSQSYILLAHPARLIVSEADSTTVLVLVWSQTEDDLERWMSVANEFIDSIHFIDVP